MTSLAGPCSAARTRCTARAASALAIVAALVVAPAAGASAGQAARSPSLTVSPGTLPADRVSTVTVTGRSYLVPPHAPGVEVFGGVYVFFGWVADATRFGPSTRNSNNNNGTVGVTYAYPGKAGDAATRDDGTGATRLVSFTAGGASGDATGFHMDGDGNWKTTMRIFGAAFATTMPDGTTRTFDCRKVRCGVFTIGAHGVASATNERFVPIRFQAGAAGSAPAPTAGGGNAPAPTAGGNVGAPTVSRSTGTPTGVAQPDSTAPADGDLAVEDGSEPGQLAGTTRSVRSTGGVSLPVLLAAAGLVVTLLAGGGLWRRRRRRSTGPHDPTAPVSPTE
ncbi:LPXTG cell wall anchor domain-containing protein [Plantactinospora sp. WMMC1484]|uniref:LPXTG cell wall anchor domain-containing protein n=1 Tax=Plantactinospora sp. WMMC1484 TaxID=3404122 RepID=UPI003BF6029A